MTTPPKARADAARNFPAATCAASRHAYAIGEEMLRETPLCGESILSTVASLWEARARIAEQDELLNAIRDLFPRSGMSKPVHKLVAERIAQLEADAARYQWLRRFDHFATVDAMLDTTEYNTLDAAVDAAREEK